MTLRFLIFLPAILASLAMLQAQSGSARNAADARPMPAEPDEEAAVEGTSTALGAGSAIFNKTKLHCSAHGRRRGVERVMEVAESKIEIGYRHRADL